MTFPGLRGSGCLANLDTQSNHQEADHFLVGVLVVLQLKPKKRAAKMTAGRRFCKHEL